MIKNGGSNKTAWANNGVKYYAMGDVVLRNLQKMG